MPFGSEIPVLDNPDRLLYARFSSGKATIVGKNEANKVERRLTFRPPVDPQVSVSTAHFGLRYQISQPANGLGAQKKKSPQPHFIHRKKHRVSVDRSLGG